MTMVWPSAHPSAASVPATFLISIVEVCMSFLLQCCILQASNKGCLLTDVNGVQRGQSDLAESLVTGSTRTAADGERKLPTSAEGNATFRWLCRRTMRQAKPRLRTNEPLQAYSTAKAVIVSPLPSPSRIQPR
jgi:hypothetical protein